MFQSTKLIHSQWQSYLIDIKYYFNQNRYFKHRPYRTKLTRVKKTTIYNQYIPLLKSIFICGSRNISNKYLAALLGVTVGRVKDLLSQLKQFGVIYQTDCHRYGIWNEKTKKVYYITDRTIYIKGTRENQMRECAKIKEDLYENTLEQVYLDIVNKMKVNATYDNDCRAFLRDGIWYEDIDESGYCKSKPIGRVLNGLFES